MKFRLSKAKSALENLLRTDEYLTDHEYARILNEHLSTPERLREFLRLLYEYWHDTDPEYAHALADDMTARVLRLIAEGHPDARDLARAVSEIDTWDVGVWFA